MAFGTVSTDVINTSDGLTLGAGNATLMKNKIINGAMLINQRNATVSSSNTETYTVDRFSIYRDGTAATFSAQQSSDAPSGFSNSLLLTTTSAGTGATNDGYWLAQKIEGFNTYDLAWGTASAKATTMSFWVKSSLTGQFGGTLVNSAFNYSFPFSYTISVANTWEYKTISISAPTSGTWIGATNGIGVRIYWDMGSGASLKGTAGSWTASGLTGATGDVSLVGTAGATWQMTGVQLERGSSATGFEYVNYQTSLANCYRYYYQRNTGVNDYPFALQAYSTTAVYGAMLQFPVTMRATPTMASSGAFLAQQGNSGSSNTIGTFGASLKSVSPFGCFSDGTSGFTGMVAGNMSNVYCNATSYISASAEL